VQERFAFRVVIMAAICALFSSGFPRQVIAEVICADDVAPKGMIIAATGTAASCAGACRAREMKPACGPIIKICAGQPIPKGYILESITTTPACECVGSDDNAYVIRYVGTRNETELPGEGSFFVNDDASQPDTTESEDQTFDYSADPDAARLLRKERHPYGDPPFGNLLCANVPTQPQSQPNGIQAPFPFPSQSRSTNQGNMQIPNGAAGPWSSSPPQSDWNDQQNEPFRVGQ
jgi:hypothetical protein